MAIKTWIAGEQVGADDLNNNFAQTLQTQNYTAGETITVGQAVYLKASDGKVWKADADAAESLDNFIGIALEGGNADDTIMIQTEGLVTGLTGLTAGSFYYVSSTAGALATTGSLKIGLAISTTSLLLTKSTVSNASETVRGIVEEATDAEVTAGTATGDTGAKLFVTPAKLATRLPTVLAPYQPIMIFKCGSTTYDMSTASGNQTIAHGVGATPKYVKLTALMVNGPHNGISSSFTVYNGTTQASAFIAQTNGDTEFSGGTFTVYDETGAYQTGVVTFDATNITIAWTKTGTITGTAYIVWEAQY